MISNLPHNRRGTKASLMADAEASRAAATVNQLARHIEDVAATQFAPAVKEFFRISDDDGGKTSVPLSEEAWELINSFDRYLNL